MKIALVGEPNCGKSTLFNRLTGGHVHTGNRAGVTVSAAKGVLRGGQTELWDLPGVYSAEPRSDDERLTFRILEKERPERVLFVADGTQLARAMPLFKALCGKYETVLAVNMCDELRRAGVLFDPRALEDHLGVRVFAVSAKSGEGVEALRAFLNDPTGGASGEEHAVRTGKGKSGAGRRGLFSKISERKEGREAVCPGAGKTGAFSENTPVCDEKRAKNAPPTHCERCGFGKVCHSAASGKGTPGTSGGERGTDGAGNRAGENAVPIPPPAPRSRIQNLADVLFLTPVVGHLCFLLILSGILFFAFGAPGNFLADGFSGLLLSPAFHLLERVAFKLPPFWYAFLAEGVLAGCGAVLSFAPRLFLLFALLTVMEDSGYLARVSALCAPMLRFFGLSGAAAIPLTLGLGCSVPAVLATRHIEEDHTRRLSLLLVPFLPCSARLPVIAALSALFFSLPVFGKAIPLLGGAVLFFVFAFAFSRKASPHPFVEELPRFRVPSVSGVFRTATERTGHFLKKAGSVILLATALLWLFSHITFRGQATENGANSILAVTAGKLAPLFAPLGFGNWQAVSALLAGVAAKETALSALMVFCGGDTRALCALLSPAGALSFLTFFATYTPCIATLLAIRREGGRRAALLSLLFSLFGAYLLSFAVYRTAMFFT